MSREPRDELRMTQVELDASVAAFCDEDSERDHFEAQAALLDSPDIIASGGEFLRSKPDGWPDACASCGAAWTEIGFDYVLGFNCRACGGSDADE